VRRILIMAALCVAAAATAGAQTQDWSAALAAKLESKASKTVDVNLDQSMLKFASAFLDQKDPDQAEAKKIVANMQGIYVHNFEFDKEGQFTEADLAMLREPLKEPVWSRIVNVKSKEEGQNVEVYFKKEGNKFIGLVVIATDEKSLTFVNIMGPIDPADLAKLGGEFGIPDVEITTDGKDKSKDKDKSKEKTEKGDKEKTKDKDKAKDSDDDSKGDDL
jgi:Domain of unknown function (DUF4252)